MKTTDSLDSLLKSIQEFGFEVTSNVTELKERIEEMENSITTKSNESFNEIKGSLNTFIKTIDDSSETIRNLDFIKRSERSDILSDYYSLIVDTRKRLSTYSIQSSDDLIQSYDEYLNDKNIYFDKVFEIYNKDLNGDGSRVIDALDITQKSVERYQDALRNYNSMYFDSLNGLVSKISSLTNLFIKNYEEFLNQDLLLSNNSIFDISLYEPSLDIKTFESDRDKLVDNLMKKYIKERRKLIDEFLEDEENEIRKIETNLLKAISSSLDVKVKVKDLSTLDNDSFIKANAILERIAKKDEGFDSIDFKNTVTEIYNQESKKIFDFYKERELKLEKEYLKVSKDLGIEEKLKEKLDSTYRTARIATDNLNTEITIKDLSKSHSEIVKSRLDNIFSFSVESERIVCALKRLLVSYKFENSLITLSLNKDLSETIISLKADYAIKEIETKDSYNEYQYELNTLRRDNRKSLSYLEYRINELKIDRKYITEKVFVKETLELLQYERKLDLVEPTKELLGLIKEYDALIKGYEFLYNSEVEVLERSRERLETSNVSNYMYCMSMLKHRTLLADELLETTRREYDLRIAMINDVTNLKKKYATLRTQEILDKYMDDRDEISRIRNNDLRVILDKIEELKLKGKAPTTKDHEEVSKVLEAYKASEEKINNLLKNDPTVLFETKEVEGFIEYVKDDKEMAELLNEELLKNALNEIASAETGLDEFMKSLEMEKVDFNVALDTYKFKYNKEKQRITEWLDKESSPILDRINDINKSYDFLYYIEKFKKLDEEHKSSLEKNKEALSTSYNDIDITFQKDEPVSSSTEIKAILESKDKELDNLINSFKTKKDSLYSIYHEEIALNEEEKISRIESIKKNTLKSNKFVMTILSDERKAGNKSIKKLRKSLNSYGRLYLRNFDELQNETNRMIEKSLKEINKKYKKYTLYDLVNEK